MRLRLLAALFVWSAAVSAASGQDARAPGDDTLTLAAECLQRGDEASAAVHLELYVRLHPEQIMFRAHLAELLLKLGRLAESKQHFERFIAMAQETAGPPRSHLVHCHTRLMEIGRRESNAFAEAFHRGVGLWLLVKQQEPGASRDDEMMEEILCKALAALREARELNPAEPRVQFYLAEVLERTGNSRAADIARSAARNQALPDCLTPQELRRISMVDQSWP